jgi:hypothetical protein
VTQLVITGREQLIGIGAVQIQLPRYLSLYPAIILSEATIVPLRVDLRERIDARRDLYCFSIEMVTHHQWR